MIETIIVNARAVCPDGIKQGCIAIDDGKIQFIGPQFMMPQARTVIDAEERFVIPGLVDPHVHYGLYGADDFVKNCKRDWEPDALGALFGGVTTVMPMLMSQGSYVPVVRELVEWGNKRSAVDFALTPIIHKDQHLRDMPELFDMGVCSFKHFFNAFKGEEGRRINVAPMEEGPFYRSLEIIRDLGAPAIAMCHAEDCDLYQIFTAREEAKGRNGLSAWADGRPQFTEWTRIHTAAALAHEAKAPLYFVHLSTQKSVEIVQEFKRKGARLAAEAVIHTLTVSRDQEEVGVWGKFVPPLRGWDDINSLWEGLRAGVIDTIATDHCTYMLEEKESGQGKNGSIWAVPPGISNVQEHWLPVLWTDGVKTGRITVEDVVRFCSENAARRFGLYPRKGAIILGADADLVIVDHETEHAVDEKFYHGKDPRLSIYKGRRLIGRPKLTMLRGRVVMQDGKLVGETRGGHYVRSRIG